MKDHERRNGAGGGERKGRRVRSKRGTPHEEGEAVHREEKRERRKEMKREERKRRKRRRKKREKRE